MLAGLCALTGGGAVLSPEFVSFAKGFGFWRQMKLLPAEGQGRFAQLVNLPISGAPRGEPASVLKARGAVPVPVEVFTLHRRAPAVPAMGATRRVYPQPRLYAR